MHLPVLNPPPAQTTLIARARALARRATENLPARLKTLKLSTAQAIWTGAAALLALFLVWMLWPRAELVEMALLDRGLVRHEIVDEGRTRLHDVFVVAAPVSGTLQRIELEPGDAVTRGQTVATLMPADPALLDSRTRAEAGASVSAGEAALAAAEADFDRARSEQARVAQLYERGFASSAARDNAQSALAAARANVAMRRADLARARAAAGTSAPGTGAPVAVRAPARGRVLRLLAESEAVVSAGAPLMEIGDPNDLEIVAEFLSQDAVGIRVGAPAAIEAWGGAPLQARVSRIEPYAHTKISALGVEEQRVNVVLRLEPTSSPPPLGHGFRVDVRVVAAEEADALRVPVDALVRDGEGWAVFQIEHGRARLTPVTLGEDGEHYRAVRNGIAEGAPVILFPGEDLRDGTRVRAAATR
jgi:HlyD family secretion protein